MQGRPVFKQKSLLRSPFAKISRTTYSEGFIMEPHEHAQTQISFILGGANHEKGEVTNTHFGRSAEVIIKPKGLIHDNVFSDNCTIITVQLMEENHSRLQKDGMLKEWRVLTATGNYQLLSALVNCRTEQQYYSCLNEMLTYFSKAGQTQKEQPPSWLLDVKHLLDTSFHSTIKNEDIGNAFSKHPVYIARMFKSYFGMSMKSYLKLLRTNGAMNSILSQEDILAGIAIKNGFADQSHLNRTMKANTGFTPRQFQHFVE